MKEQLKQSLLAKYPTWHNQPLNLTVSEIEDPKSVLEFFFTCYGLPDIRTSLKELLYDSLRAEGADVASHVSTHRDLEKLVEAVWVIHEQNNNSTAIQKQGLSFDKIEPKGVGTENVKLVRSHRCIHEFFESFTLPFARDYLSSALKASESSQVWNKAAPNDLLYFFESLEGLLTAVYKIVKEGKVIQKVILPKSPNSLDLTQCHLYCGRYDQLKPWDYFPRTLSVKEYRNPYKVLEKFTYSVTKNEWKEILRYLLSYALGANSLSELSVNLELVRISEDLQKMLEACHLIYVRTTIQTPKS